MRIHKIAQQKIVEEIAYNLNKLNNDNIEDIQDLIQDTYLNFLDNADKIESIPNKEIKYYITKYLKNNIFSVTSRYHYKYRKPKEKLIPLDNIEKDTDEDRNDI